MLSTLQKKHLALKESSMKTFRYWLSARKIAAVLILVGLLWVGLHATARADTNNFTITDFSVDETLSSGDPQGRLHVTETISVVFTDQNHGLLRAIPKEYKGHSLSLRNIRVSSPSSAPSQFTTYTSNGNEVLRIGDPASTVTGAQTYVVRYDVDNVMTFYNDHDELYWDVNGDQWAQQTKKVSLTLHLPKDAKLSGQPTRCFAGNYGTTNGTCLISQEGSTVRASAFDLGPNQTLTTVTSFQKGFFQPETTGEKFAQFIKPVASILLLPLVTAIVGFRYWWKRGRDDKGRGTIVPQYDAPDGMTPIEAGTIADFKTDNRDITATIINLALRGYIKIIETKEKRLLGKDKMVYTLELVRADQAGLKDYEKLLIEGLFVPATVGETLIVGSSSRKLYNVSSDVRKMIDAQLKANGYFRDNSWRTLFGPKAIFWSIVLFAFLIFGLILGQGLFVASVGISIVILIIVRSVMAARTAKGVAAKEHIAGLKMYLETAEADRIKMLQSPNAPYATNHDAPQKTVELFEKLLPYAMILGVENEWAKQFEGIYTAPPDWHSGNWTAFNAGVLTQSLGSGFQSSLNSAFTPPSLSLIHI